MLCSLAVSEFQVTKGNSIEIQNANSTIEWGRNYTFNASKIATHNSTLSIGDKSISIYSDAPEQINSTLWVYNLSQPGFNDQLIKVETSAVPNSTVHFEFTDIPPISRGEYRLNVDGSTVEKFGSGGTVSWSYSDWSFHNFSLSYEEKPEPPEEDTGDDSDGGSSIGGGGGSYVSAGCEESETSDGHSWSLVNRSEFVFDNTNSEIGIQRIEVSTQANRSEFAVCTGRLENVSAQGFEKPTNTYAVYQFEVNQASETEIKSATIQFEVNQSFATQYDRTVLSRYNDGWKYIDTTLIESTGEKWLYEAIVPRFSYYAVRGENQSENRNTSSQNQSAGNRTNPVCGDDLCQTGEYWESCSTDCQKPEEVVKAENTILDAQQQIAEGEPGYQTLQQARNRFENGRYSEAERLAQKALKQHQNRSKQRSNQLPWILIVAAVAGLLLLAVTGFYGYRRWIKTQIDREIREIYENVLQGDGEVNHAGRVKTELDRAKKALQMGKHRQAKRALDRIKELLDR